MFHADDISPILELAEAISQFGEPTEDHHYNLADVLGIGADAPFECAVSGKTTWAGKVLLERAGGWKAYKYL